MPCITSLKVCVIRFISISIALLLASWSVYLMEVQATEPSPGNNSQQFEPLPGDGKYVRMARADWDTGWFQTEIFKLLMEELGYDVSDPVTMGSWDFYLAAAEGDKDLWVNGWFPSNFF